VGNQLGKAQNPPPGDPNHRHETWMKHDTEQRFRVQYSEADIPDYFALARQYTLCDHFFSEVAGPSTPSHLMLITADSRNQQSALQFALTAEKAPQLS
jgi:phospholipase C